MRTKGTHDYLHMHRHIAWICGHMGPHIRLHMLLFFCVAVIIHSAGCGGGSRGTGSYGLDGTRPASISEDTNRIRRTAPRQATPEASPTPRK